MKKYTVESIEEMFTNVIGIEEMVYTTSSIFRNIPVTVSRESWKGLEIRITENGTSECFGPLHWRINIADYKLICNLANLFASIDRKMVTLLDGVSFEKEFHVLSWKLATPTNIQDMIRRWERFNTLILKHFPAYGEPDRDHDWLTSTNIPENYVAWTARSVLGGIKPSKVALEAFKQNRVEILPTGHLVFTEASGYYTRWHFARDTDAKHVGAINSFGDAALSLMINAAFSDDPDVIVGRKLPEQWEIDANVFIGVKHEKKSLLLRNKK